MIYRQVQFIVCMLLLVPVYMHADVAEAASLQISPSTGVYQVGDTFTATVQVVTAGQPVNAAEGVLRFNPDELSVISVTRSGSIFNLWVEEPMFSNSSGQITFSGGVPTGYDGAVGIVLKATFRVKNAGNPRVSFTTGSVLANDGRGTNVLTSMSGGSYTIQAQAADPEPERIVEYVPQANTPIRPEVSSVSHPDPDAWYNTTNAQLSWTVPDDVTAVRTLLNESPNAIPTVVYDTPISDITLEDVPEGVSYFHIQFRNQDGWGAVTHRRIAVDTVSPTGVSLQIATSSDSSSPRQELQVEADEGGSPIERYEVSINAGDPFVVPANASSTLILNDLNPGFYTVIVEVFDAAGNSAITDYAFTVEAFAPPQITSIPTEMSGDVIPVIQGNTRPSAAVTIELQRLGADPMIYTVQADADGMFTFIPSGQLDIGVYELTAFAVDSFGAKSDISPTYRIAVQQPGFVRIGGQLIDVLSVGITLVALLAAVILLLWYVRLIMHRLRAGVRKESHEVTVQLDTEFSHLLNVIEEHEALLIASRRTKKLTKAEEETINHFREELQLAQKRVKKEINDVESLVK